jgi:gentisate 1,2-dioxygenase
MDVRRNSAFAVSPDSYRSIVRSDLEKIMFDKTFASALTADASVMEDARYFEYTSSANPIGAKLISRVPYHAFPPSLYDSGATRVVPLDLSRELDCEGPATGPGLCANFLRINAGEKIVVNPNATSLVFYAIQGAGTASQDETRINYSGGDFFTFPGGAAVEFAADRLSRLYYVNDAPLLAYLGASVNHTRFEPTLYPASKAQEALNSVAGLSGAGQRSRVSILLGNAQFPQTRTVTHTLWAMFGVVAPNTMQKPHRHQSIALDFISDCKPGCYTLVGPELGSDGSIVHAERVDWEPGMVFVTPPGYWHAHYNESSENGYVIPIQDAGLQTYLRALDIRFSH